MDCSGCGVRAVKVSRGFIEVLEDVVLFVWLWGVCQGIFVGVDFKMRIAGCQFDMWGTCIGCSCLGLLHLNL